MLALSRKPGETIVIPKLGITITLVEKKIRDGSVKLAFDAPEDVVIFRGEVWDRIKDDPNADIDAILNDRANRNKRDAA